MDRDLPALEGSIFDLLVIGGGILGACVARDAALRGLRVALIEAGDFGGATSANSLKIVHGGLRYLQHLDFRRVRASIRERSMWLRIAPHLVEPLPVVVPTYASGRQRRGLLRAALALSDLAGFDRNRRLPADRQLPAGRALSRDELVRLVPELGSRRLTGGVLFHDAQMYSAERLTLAVVHAAARAGAVVANYVACEGPRLGSGRLDGIEASDRIAGERFTLRARHIVNAAGAAAGAVAARLAGRVTRAETAFSVAVNVQLPALGHRVAFALSEEAADRGRGSSGRQLFVTPWRDATLIGTGHFAVPHLADGDDSAEAAVAAFLAELNRAWPGAPFDRADLTLVHRGLLPVDRPGGESPLRRHRLIDHAADGIPNLISVVSVKYTTARLVAESVVDLVFRKRGERAPPCTSATTLLPDAPSGAVTAALERARAHAPPVLDEEVVWHLLRSYGEAWTQVASLHTDVRGWSDRVIAGLPVIRAQLAHAVRRELARKVDDLVWRRTEIGARGRDGHEARSAAAAMLERLTSARPRAVEAPPLSGEAR